MGSPAQIQAWAGPRRLDQPLEWVWSSKPTHDALVDLETLVQAQQSAERRERSRTAPGRNPDPQTKRVYRLRSFLLCHQCGRRLYGKTKRSTPYYVCQPKKAWRADGHPLSTWRGACPRRLSPTRTPPPCA